MAPEAPVIRASKRKRNPVSYLADEYFESIDFALSEQDNEKEAAVESDRDEGLDSNDLDGTFNGHSNGKPSTKKKVKATPKAKKVKPVQPFRFMDLPAELRDEIYDLVLTDPSGMTLVSRTRAHRRSVQRGIVAIEDGPVYSGKLQPVFRGFYGFSSRNTATPTYIGDIRAQLSPNICAVSKQLREEASNILYKQEIIVEDTTALHLFVTMIGSFNRQLLAQITIKGWGLRKSTSGNNFAAFAAMTECVNLQSVFLDCSIGYYFRTQQKLAQRIYKDAHLFLEAYGSANGGSDAAIDVLEMSEFHFKENTANATGKTFSEKSYGELKVALRSLFNR